MTYFAPRTSALLERVCLAVLAVCSVISLVATLHWPLVNDPSQIDYICFTIGHGMSPYRDLIEMNMPGAYLTNWMVLHTMGPSALAWRLFDIGILAISVVALYWLCRTTSRTAGALAGCMFVLLHVRDGAGQLGQRDLIVGVLMLLVFCCLFALYRGASPLWMFPAGLFLGYASIIKPPPLPFGLLMIGFALWRRLRNRQSVIAPLLYTLLGLSVPIVVTVLFLARHQAVSAFVYVLQIMLPYYAKLGRHSLGLLWRDLSLPAIKELTALALIIIVLRRSWGNWEQKFLLAGSVFGIISFFSQGKGFPYHRYPLLVFLLPWIFLAVCTGLRDRKKSIALLAATALVLAAIVGPIYMVKGIRMHWHQESEQAMEHDLRTLSVKGSLSGRVQCITTIAECHTALLHLGYVQATGLFYDYFVFGPAGEPAIRHSRQLFMRQMKEHMPDVILISDGLFPSTKDEYSKLDKWAEFHDLLASHYRLLTQRSFEYAESGPQGYRIYAVPGYSLTPQAPTEPYTFTLR